jgi:hypothetical protein
VLRSADHRDDITQDDPDRQYVVLREGLTNS